MCTSLGPRSRVLRAFPAFVPAPHTVTASIAYGCRLECPLCVKTFCLVCRTEPWHTGVRCEAWQAEHGNVEEADKMFSAFAAQQKLKQCPRCRFFVEKSSGCDAMHCRCDLVFCYKCGGVLKATAKLKQCECNGMAPYLQAHTGVANINNPAFGGGGGGGRGGGPFGGNFAPAALAALQAMQQAMGGGGNGGGGVPMPDRGRGRPNANAGPVPNVGSRGRRNRPH